MHNATRSSKKKNSSNGFERGLEPEMIVGACEKNGVFHLLVKWEGLADPEAVPASVANIKCPQLVIQWYEKITVIRRGRTLTEMLEETVKSEP